MRALCLLAVCGLLQRAAGDCLGSGVLEALGFTAGNFTSSNGGSNSTLCGSLAAQSGLCTDPTLLGAKIYTDMSTFTTRYNVVQRLGTALDLLVANATLYDQRYSASQLAEFVQFAVATKAEIEQNREKCHATLAKAQMGANCLLASGAASSAVQLTPTGAQLLVTADLAASVASDCLAIFDVLCLLSAGRAISEAVSLPAAYSYASPRAVAGCASLANYTACVGGSCASDQRPQLLYALVRLFDPALFPPDAFFDGLAEQVSEVEASAPASKLQAQGSDWDVVLVVGARGQDLSGLGASSGVEVLQPFAAMSAFLLLPPLILLLNLL